MEVIIDGQMYVPDKSKKILVGEIEYDSVRHWLFNIHASLTRDFVNTAKELYKDNSVETITEENVKRLTKMNERVKQFEKFCSEFLGFSDIGNPELL